MFVLLNWTMLDDISLCYNEDGSPMLFDTYVKAEVEAKQYNGFTKVVNLDE